MSCPVSYGKQREFDKTKMSQTSPEFDILVSSSLHGMDYSLFCPPVFHM